MYYGRVFAPREDHSDHELYLTYLVHVGASVLFRTLELSVIQHLLNRRTWRFSST